MALHPRGVADVDGVVLLVFVSEQNTHECSDASRLFVAKGFFRLCRMYVASVLAIRNATND